MNITPASVVIAGAGGVLIYSAVKGYDPRDVVKSALSGDWPPVATLATTPSGEGDAPYSGGKSPIPPFAGTNPPNQSPTRKRRRKRNNTSPTVTVRAPWNPPQNQVEV